MDIENRPQLVNIRVVGVGGGGGNALNTMVAGHLAGAEFIACNTDTQSLAVSRATRRFSWASASPRGSVPAPIEIGREAALESREAIEQALAGADMVFITAGMGGGTGTGATPVVAEIARAKGALTVGVVTRRYFEETGAASKRRAGSSSSRPRWMRSSSSQPAPAVHR